MSSESTIVRVSHEVRAGRGSGIRWVHIAGTPDLGSPKALDVVGPFGNEILIGWNEDEALAIRRKDLDELLAMFEPKPTADAPKSPGPCPACGKPALEGHLCVVEKTRSFEPVPVWRKEVEAIHAQLVRLEDAVLENRADHMQEKTEKMRREADSLRARVAQVEAQLRDREAWIKRLEEKIAVLEGIVGGDERRFGLGFQLASLRRDVKDLAAKYGVAAAQGMRVETDLDRTARGCVFHVKDLGCRISGVVCAASDECRLRKGPVTVEGKP